MIKVAAGASHSLVLTATGDVFVFGSNHNGEIKQTVAYQLHPTIVKLGTGVIALDIAAGLAFSLLMVSGPDSTNPEIYYWGSVSSAAENMPTAIRITALKEVCYQIMIL